jgi:hypothetical protein
VTILIADPSSNTSIFRFRLLSTTQIFAERFHEKMGFHHKSNRTPFECLYVVLFLSSTRRTASVVRIPFFVQFIACAHSCALGITPQTQISEFSFTLLTYGAEPFLRSCQLCSVYKNHTFNKETTHLTKTAQYIARIFSV